MPETTDTPLSTNVIPRPPALEQWKAFIGDLARPFAIIGTTIGFNHSLVIVAHKLGPDASAAAIFIGAAGGVLVGVYGAKSWEMAQSAKQAANVEVAKAAVPVEVKP